MFDRYSWRCRVDFVTSQKAYTPENFKFPLKIKMYNCCLITCFLACYFNSSFLFTTRKYRQFFTSSMASASDFPSTRCLLLWIWPERLKSSIRVLAFLTVLSESLNFRSSPGDIGGVEHDTSPTSALFRRKSTKLVSSTTDCEDVKLRVLVYDVLVRVGDEGVLWSLSAISTGKDGRGSLFLLSDSGVLWEDKEDEVVEGTLAVQDFGRGRDVFIRESPILVVIFVSFDLLSRVKPELSRTGTELVFPFPYSEEIFGGVLLANETQCSFAFSEGNVNEGLSGWSSLPKFKSLNDRGKLFNPWFVASGLTTVWSITSGGVN